MDESMRSCAYAVKELTSASQNILEVQKQFNDNFLLHSKESQVRWENMCKEIAAQTAAVGEIRKDFKDWFYPLMGDILKKVIYVSLTIAGAAIGLKVTGLW